MTLDEDHDAHDSAGHAEHFLQRLDRLDRERLELALTMYRDHQTVRAVLARLPPERGTKRVAFALSNERPAFVLTTHEGRFVTCLAPGMTADNCHVVPFAKLVGHVQAVERDALRGEALRERTKLRANDPIRRLIASNGWLPREDVSAVLATQAALESEYFHMWILATRTISVTLQQLSESDKPTQRGRVDEARLRTLSRTVNAMGNLGLVASAGTGRELAWHLEMVRKSPYFVPWAISLRTMRPYLVLQTLGALARLGAGVAPLFERTMDTQPVWQGVFEVAVPLAGIAARADDPGERERLLAVLASDGAGAGEGRASRLAARWVRERLVEHVREHPGLSGAMLEGYGRAAFEALERKRGPLSLRDYDPSVLRVLGAVHPARKTTEEAEMGEYLRMMPWAARAEVEDFFVPEARARELRTPWTRDDAWELYDALTKTIDTKSQKAPVRAEEKPGRNDPCSCGSGKKYKKCCGG